MPFGSSMPWRLSLLLTFLIKSSDSSAKIKFVAAMAPTTSLTSSTFSASTVSSAWTVSSAVSAYSISTSFYSSTTLSSTTYSATASATSSTTLSSTTYSATTSATSSTTKGVSSVFFYKSAIATFYPKGAAIKAEFGSWTIIEAFFGIFSGAAPKPSGSSV